MAIEIDTIEKLIEFSNGDYGRGSSSEYLDVKLIADLDFADLTENDIPYNWAGCTGSWYVNFDGQGHTIDNIYFIGTGNWGFFQELSTGSTVKNLKMTNMYIAASCSVSGGAAGVVSIAGSNCIIQNCHISGQIENTSVSGGYGYNNNCVAGVVGLPNGGGTKILNCSFSGVLKVAAGADAHAHGIVGHGKNGGCSVYNCMANVNFASDSAAHVGIKCFDNQETVNCEFRGQNVEYPFGFNTNVNCIGIVESYSKTIQCPNSHSNCYMDSDKASAAGITIPSNCGSATTAELKDSSWLFAHGFAI